jgi:hypothetical protein
MATGAGDDAREQAVAFLKRKRKFFRDASTYVAVNAALWVIWAIDRSGSDPVPWPVWPTAIWGVFVAMDAVRVFGPWARRMHAPISETEIQREIERHAHRV